MSKRSGISDKAQAMLAQVAPKRSAPPPPKPKVQLSGPTPEQLSKADYERPNALHYRRRPLFETLAKTHDWISSDGLRAMRMYREWFEDSNKSLTRCSLDVEGRGGGTPSGLPPIIGASFSLQLCQAAIGSVADVFDKVALQDKSFSEVAIERFGSRRQSWITQPSAKGAKLGRPAKVSEKIVPKSGRHREIIAHEFRAGLKRLVEMVATLTSTTRRLVAVPAFAPIKEAVDRDGVTMSEAANEAAHLDAAVNVFVIDPRFFNEAGYMRPYEEIAAILLSKDSDDDMAA